MEANKYVPALSLRWLTRFYDALFEKPIEALRLRADVIAALGDLAGRSVLDVGCGTGSLVVALKKAQPDARVTGLDGDPEILEIARRKARDRGLDVRFSQGMSFQLPYPDGSFDAVTTSLMLHHLSREAKDRTAAEMYRVLKPGGMLVGVDAAEPRTRAARAVRPILRRMERAAENLDGLLPAIFTAAGFQGFTELRSYLGGLVALFRAGKPAG